MRYTRETFTLAAKERQKEIERKIDRKKEKGREKRSRLDSLRIFAFSRRTCFRTEWKKKRKKEINRKRQRQKRQIDREKEKIEVKQRNRERKKERKRKRERERERQVGPHLRERKQRGNEDKMQHSSCEKKKKLSEK